MVGRRGIIHRNSILITVGRDGSRSESFLHIVSYFHQVIEWLCIRDAK